MTARTAPYSPDNATMPGRVWLICGAFSAALAVAAGAIGAHLLKGRLEDTLLETFEVAVRYQIYHALGLMIVGILAAGMGRSANWAGVLFMLGTVLFSGGLYAWIISGSHFFVMLVPLGGLAFIAGWLAMAIGHLAK